MEKKVEIGQMVFKKSQAQHSQKKNMNNKNKEKQYKNDFKY